MEQLSTPEADMYSIGEKIPRLIQNEKVTCQPHNSSPMAHIVTHINQVQHSTLFLCDILQYYRRTYDQVSQVAPSLQYFTRKVCTLFLLPTYHFMPAYHILTDFVNLIISREQHRHISELLITQFSTLSCSVLPLRQNILLSIANHVTLRTKIYTHIKQQIKTK